MFGEGIDSLSINWTLGNKLKWKLNRNSDFWLKKAWDICKKVAIVMSQFITHHIKGHWYFICRSSELAHRWPFFQAVCQLTNTRVTLYTAGHLHTAVPHCSHSRAPIVHTAVPRENNEHGCVYLRCRAVCKLPGCVEGHPCNIKGPWGDNLITETPNLPIVAVAAAVASYPAPSHPPWTTVQPVWGMVTYKAVPL